MAVNLTRQDGLIYMTGGTTWDVLATIPAGDSINGTVMILDVKIYGCSSQILEFGIVAWYQSVYVKTTGGTLSLLGTIKEMKKKEINVSNPLEYRQVISSGNVSVEVREAVSGAKIYYDIQLYNTQ